jgi:hypothetical protein
VILTYGLRWCDTGEKLADLLKQSGRGLSIILVVSVLYAGFIFWDRIHCNEGHVASADYERSFYRELSAEGYEIKIEDDALRIPVMFGIYLSNSSWNFEKILTERPPSIPIMTNVLLRLLVRLQVLESSSLEEAPRTYKHGLLSLPGVAWYEFGTGGMLVIAMVHGVLIVTSAWLLTCCGVWGRIGTAAFFSIGLITLWSPLCFAVANMSFPFVAFAYFVTSIAHGLRYR